MTGDWITHPLVAEYSLTADWDDRWRTGGTVDEVIEEAHLSPRHIVEGIERFARERESRLGRLREALRATGANALQVMVYAVWPQVRVAFTGISIYTLDVAFRAATVVGFFGGGAVASGFDEFDTGTFAWSGGAGIRFMVAQKNRINVRLDYGVAQDESAIVLFVKEAF